MFNRPAAPAPATVPVTRSSVIDLTKKAALSLDKHGLTGQKAAVYLALDRSGSMRDHYRDGSVQYLAEQILGLARNLDDDGSVPVVFFSTGIDGTTEVKLDNYAGRIQNRHQQLGHMGLTHYEKAIEHVTGLHLASRAHAQGIPALVVFQTDGGPSDKEAAEAALRAASNLPLFFAFVGYGTRIEFLRKLDDLDGRAVDNAGYLPVPDPRSVDDDVLYDGVTGQYKPWLAQARSQGIVR
ncbi:VWA domain-containing protein [Streptomyces yaizuensis]|uniref:VWA domain-containing protein n=1 Tax=Streptomyces yaizuensis TaxID=2989713 RepID=A0ABQ5P6J4_9ACTN|nr:VWA domain-containing protein [Streptomyces sp. YSPA8]GLF98209.1 VWA domain-containing protein [Streptomyces sp. YSPA8]